MDIKKGQEIELHIKKMAFGGKGISKHNGLAIFVDNAVPGDTVRARIVKKKKSFAEARLLEVTTPSEDRRTAECKYSDYCGGCKWQFLEYEKQLEYKRQHVAESLEHIGLLRDIEVLPTIPSERVLGYRNKMEFSCSDRRWLLPGEMDDPAVEKGFALGLHVPGTYHKILDNDYCLLMPETGNQILEDVRTYMKNSEAPVYGLKTHIGFWRFLMLRHSSAYDQWMVNIVTASEDRKIVQPLADRLTDRFPKVISVVNNITSRKAGIAFGEYEILLSGQSVLKEKILNYVFEISANSFFQTNTNSAEKLYTIVKRFARLTGKESVLDLYCGAGAISIFLSDSARDIVGMEIVEDAVSDARNNCNLNHVSNCRFVSGDIRKNLPEVYANSENQKPEVMIIDPPRAGMHKDVVAGVIDLSPERIVYVSCNPTTLARDVGLLKDDYHVVEVQPVDMFPHTYHIESVARLEKRRR